MSSISTELYSRRIARGQEEGTIQACLNDSLGQEGSRRSSSTLSDEELRKIVAYPAGLIVLHRLEQEESNSTKGN